MKSLGMKVTLINAVLALCLIFFSVAALARGGYHYGNNHRGGYHNGYYGGAYHGRYYNNSWRRGGWGVVGVPSGRYYAPVCRWVRACNRNGCVRVRRCY